MRIGEISADERNKCKKVIDAFGELFALQEDMLAVDAGKHGILLMYYFNGKNFEFNELFTDSRALFEELWSDWMEYYLLSPVLGTAASELDFEELYEILPKEQKEELARKKQAFWYDSFGV